MDPLPEPWVVELARSLPFGYWEVRRWVVSLATLGCTPAQTRRVFDVAARTGASIDVVVRALFPSPPAPAIRAGESPY
jgi:hypothetical protein